MKNTKKLVVLLMALTMVVAFAACGGGEKADEDVPTYIAVTEPTFPPFDQTDEDGNIVGFDMDLLNAIAEDQGFKVEYMSMGFDALIPALEADNADIIAAGMNAEDPARQAKVDFSDTYYDSGLVLMVTEDSAITSWDDLTADMKVSSQIGTTGGDKAQELADAGTIAEAVILDQFTTCVTQLKNGDVQAVIIDKPVAEAYIAKQGGVKIVGDTVNAESYGFAVQKGNDELREKINAGLKNVIENGTYDELKAKWFQ
jgi:ABC-type amino acid transport substrate-binding protein